MTVSPAAVHAHRVQRPVQEPDDLRLVRVVFEDLPAAVADERLEGAGESDLVPPVSPPRHPKSAYQPECFA